MALKITGLKDLRWDGMVYPDRSGATMLSAAAADRHGHTMVVVSDSGAPQIRQWTDPAEYLSWHVKVVHSGTYRLLALYSAAAASGVSLEVGAVNLAAALPATAGWNDSRSVEVGTIDIPVPGDVEVSLKPQDATHWNPINFTSLSLIAAK